MIQKLQRGWRFTPGTSPYAFSYNLENEDIQNRQITPIKTLQYIIPKYGFSSESSQTNVYQPIVTDIQRDITDEKPLGTTTAKRIIKAKQQEQWPTIQKPVFNREVQDEINRTAQFQKVLTPIQNGLNVAEYFPVVGNAISFGKAGSEAINGNLLGAGLTIGLSLLPNKGFKNTLKGFNPNAFPQDLKNPLFLSHTITGSSLSRAINENGNRIAAPSIAIVGSTKNKVPSVKYPVLSDDGVYTFYFRPNYIDGLEHRATSRDMFSPTYANAETWAGKSLTPEEVIKVKRDILNQYNTLTDLQDLTDFATHEVINGETTYTDLGIPITLEDILRIERRIPPTLQNAGHSLKNRQKHTGDIYGYGEVMPLDFVDLKQAPVVIGGGSYNPIVRDFLNTMNFYEIGKPVTGNPYNVRGLAFKNGGNIQK